MPLNKLSIANIRRTVSNRITEAKWRLKYNIYHAIALKEIRRRWAKRIPGQKHKLPAALIVSLTSYPKRYPTLHLTLRCLLTQSIAADCIVLWISSDDFEALPEDVLELAASSGLIIRTTKDIRSFKKIIPTLSEWPDAFIVTADDDVYYGGDWLRQLVDAYSGGREIICHRARAATIDSAGRLTPYSTWAYDRHDFREAEIIPTGIGGVLYSPRSLHPEVLNEERFLQLCPDGDDLWLAWMGRLAGSEYRKVKKRNEFVTWKGSQESALWFENVRSGRNDQQIANLESVYGPLNSPRVQRS